VFDQARLNVTNRSILEYYSTVWAPHSSQDNYKLESVEYHIILNDYSYTSSVTRVLEHLSWATLIQHCAEAKLIQNCKEDSN